MLYQNDLQDENQVSFTEKVVQVRRVAKVVKGGRHLTFNAMVVVGDGMGRVGVGLGKGIAVPDAVRKGNTVAKKQLLHVPLKGNTIPHMVRAKFGASRVLIKPAVPGAGIIAGGAVRAVLEAAGVKDVVAKVLGSRNAINVVKATMEGLKLLQGSPVSKDSLPDNQAAVGTSSSDSVGSNIEKISEVPEQDQVNTNVDSSLNQQATVSDGEGQSGEPLSDVPTTLEGSDQPVAHDAIDGEKEGENKVISESKTTDDLDNPEETTPEETGDG